MVLLLEDERHNISNSGRLSKNKNIRQLDKRSELCSMNEGTDHLVRIELQNACATDDHLELSTLCRRNCC